MIVLFNDGFSLSKLPVQILYKEDIYTHRKATPMTTFDFYRFYFKKGDAIAPFKNQSNEYINFFRS